MILDLSEFWAAEAANLIILSPEGQGAFIAEELHRAGSVSRNPVWICHMMETFFEDYWNL
jgi:hypothetical protein